MNARDELCSRLDDALSQRGLTQEILLLRLANGLIAQFATSEADWRDAPPLEHGQWQQEIRKLANSLAFMIASADAYGVKRSGLASEIEQRSADIDRLEQELQELGERNESLKDRLATLKDSLDCGQAEQAALGREVHLLNRLQELVTFRAALRERIGVQRLHALANCELAREQGRQRERVEALQAEIELGLGKLDQILQDNLGLTEEEWNALRQSLTQQAS